MSPYRVLSMDGGGIRGILTARLLERIEEVEPGFLNQVELVAGTSTGGLLALGIAAGMTPKQLREMYEQFANRVFADSLFDNIKDLGNLIGAQYSYQPLKEVMTEFFGASILSQLKKKVLIATFQLDNECKDPNGVRMWKMKFFENYPHPGSDEDQSVVDVGVRTAVAPSYFPIYQGFIDGGVAAANPAMCALAQALDKSTGKQSLQDMALLSIGTGYNPHYLPVKEADWGLAQWAPHMLNIMLESDSDMVNFQCRQVMDDHYLRVNPVLPTEMGMDEIKYIPQLLETANQIPLDSILGWLRSYYC